MKIFIAVPTFENISPATFKSIYGLDRCGHWVVFDYITGYDCATARNRIAKQAIAEQADYVLMIDSDMTITESILREYYCDGDMLERMMTGLIHCGLESPISSSCCPTRGIGALRRKEPGPTLTGLRMRIWPSWNLPMMTASTSTTGIPILQMRSSRQRRKRRYAGSSPNRQKSGVRSSLHPMTISGARIVPSIMNLSLERR